MKREPADLATLIEERFFTATYLAVVERAYGTSGLAAAKALLEQIRRDGEKALDKHARPAAAEAGKAAPQTISGKDRSEFVLACRPGRRSSARSASCLS